MFVRLRRHPLLTLIAFLLCAAASALALFLYSFDLNDYRDQLQSTLQESLGRPVKIGSVHFAINNGLSLDLRGAEIGHPTDAVSLRLDHLLLRLRIAPLLQQQKFSFSSIHLNGAQIQIISAGETVKTPTPKTEQMENLIKLLRRTDIESFSLKKSRITIIDQGRSYQLDNIALELNELAFLAPFSVRASGDLMVGEIKSPWKLWGKISPAEKNGDWRATSFDLKAESKGIQLEQLPPFPGGEGEKNPLRGPVDLDINLRGSRLTGVHFALHASSTALSISLPKLYTTPLRVREGSIEGLWRNGTPGTIDDLVIKADTLAVRGAIILPQGKEPLTATLAVAEIPLAHLGTLLPDKALPFVTETLRGTGVNGSVASDKVILSWSPEGGVTLKSAHISLRNGTLHLKEVGWIEGAHGEADWGANTLTMTSLRGKILGGQGTMSGKIRFQSKKEPLLDLKISGSATAEELIFLLPLIWQERLEARGPLAYNGKIEGTFSTLLLDLQSNFKGSSLSFNQIPLKKAGEIGEILVLGKITTNRLELSHALLTLPFGEARSNGRLALDESGGYELACDIRKLRLEKLPVFLSVQKELRGKGEVDLRLDLNGDVHGLKSLQGSGEYRKLGIHLWDAVADLKEGSGRMILSRDGIVFPAISAQIGLSPVRATAELKWLPEFKLTLNLDLAKTRAADLVFNSPKKIFDSIRGQLVITSEKILFNKISAEIADETTALINGKLTYNPLKVALDIGASKANIAGIIALWEDKEKKEPLPPSPPPAEENHRLSVEITTSIAAGDLFGVSFQEGNGTITVKDGKLLIQPLRLKIGSGKATIAITTGPLHDINPLLKISGEAEKVDAAIVQKQLLRRQGSITGTLSGTFYLEGEIGRFLPTCSGNVNMRLTQGLLRGFTSISRALALFNVSKILTFNFPDVDKDGLLFDRIKGNLLFNKGILNSEDLSLSSAAFDMAFVGKADLSKDKLDFIIGVKPLQTVDKVLSSIPLAGWILTGEKKAFVVAQFHVTGSSQDPKVEAIPFSSLSDMAVGIFKRTFGLPGKIVNDIGELFK